MAVVAKRCPGLRQVDLRINCAQHQDQIERNRTGAVTQAVLTSMKMTRMTTALPAFLLLLAATCAVAENDYPSRRAAAKQQCEKINRDDYQSGLSFNPDGYRSYFVQSECLQRVAVQFRDASLCDGVRQRHSLLSSSWGVSREQCGKLVSNGVAADREELNREKQLYVSNPMRLKSIRIERNGNGRDFDVLPEFSGSNGHGYRLTLEIVNDRAEPIVVHSDGYCVDPNSRLRIFVRQSDIRSRFPEFQPNHSYRVRATAIYSIGMGGESGYWSEGFIESVFPVRERSQELTQVNRF